MIRMSWGWVPVLAIGVTVVANFVFIAVALRVRPERVSANPFLAAMQEDDQRAAQRRFITDGCQLAVSLDHGLATLCLTGPVPKRAQVALYRADAASADAVHLWPDPTAPLALPLAPGPWQITVTAGEGSAAIVHILPIDVPP